MKTKPYEIKEILPNIFHLHFQTKGELTRTFIRFQEYYESPEFRNKIFSLKEYKQWYIKNSKKGLTTNKFTYFSDWSGFNIPSNILIPFYEGKLNPLLKREKVFLEEFKNKTSSFYVIGTFESKREITLQHEIGHALYSTNKEYKEKINNILESMPNHIIKTFNNYFSKSGGYHESVFDDERHAYLISDGKNKKFIEKDLKLTSDEILEYTKKIHDIFNSFVGEKYNL
jgi:hypothetical protein